MRRAVAVWVAVIGLLVGVIGLAGTAGAETQSVKGAGPISKMVANNGKNAVLVKLYGTGGKAKVRWVNVSIRGKTGGTVKAQGAWYGADWINSLEKGEKLVSCPGLEIGWNGTKKFWRFLVPRSCLKGLADKVKVSAELVANTTAQPGEAGPTTWLRRG